jgi:ATP-binding cassette subfamily G (WHITE) protein 2 (PDR)
MQGDKNTQIFTTNALLFTCLFYSLIDTTMHTLLLFPETKGVLMREWRNGMYALWPRYVSAMIQALLMQAIGAIVYTASIYRLTGLQPHFDKILKFVWVMILVATAGGGIGMTAGACARSFATARVLVMGLILPLLIFSGFLIPYDYLQPWFKPLYHANPVQYANALLLINEYSDRTLSDCPLGSIKQRIGLCFYYGNDLLDYVHLDPNDDKRDFCILFLLNGVLFVLGYLAFSSAVRSKTR